MRPSDEITLYHFPPSLCSQKVRLALAEKGASYTPRLVNIGPVMENYEPWYARLNPRMVVPTLVIGSAVLTDSVNIINAVDRRLDGPDLGADQAVVAGWIDLQNGLKLRELGYARQTGLMGFLIKGSFEQRVQTLTRRRDENPDLAPLYQARLDDVLAWQETSGTPAKVEQLRSKVFDALSNLDAALAGSDFLATAKYSLADVVWTVLLARLKFMGFDADWGAVTTAYYARMKARPSFKAADIWERPKPLVMLPIVGSVLAHRLGLR